IGLCASAGLVEGVVFNDVAGHLVSIGLVENAFSVVQIESIVLDNVVVTAMNLHGVAGATFINHVARDRHSIYSIIQINSLVCTIYARAVDVVVRNGAVQLFCVTGVCNDVNGTVVTNWIGASVGRGCGRNVIGVHDCVVCKREPSASFSIVHLNANPGGIF